MPKTRTLLSDRSGYTYHLQRIGDRTYPDYSTYTDSDYSELLEKIRNLDIRFDDVLTVGYPKSGNTWMFEVINMVMAHRAEYTEKTLARTLMDLQPLKNIDRLKDGPSPRMLFSHLSFDSLPIQIVEKKPRIVYLVRNFKDMVVSMYTWLGVINTPLLYKGKWEDFLDIMQRDQFVYGGWFSHVKLADQFIRNHPQVPVHVVFYEKLKANPVEEIRKLCLFLQKPPDLAEEMARLLEFKAMKSTLTKFDDLDKDICEPGAEYGFLRKGEVGEWRHHFTIEQNETANRIIQEQLGNSPIAAVLKPYMGVSSARL